MTRLVLHAGFHKTGTTAVQECAGKNRRRLHKSGVLFPDYRPLSFRRVKAHHYFAHAVAEKGRHLTLDNARMLAGRWRQQAAAENQWVLLSSEAMCRHVIKKDGSRKAGRKRYLQRLREVLSGFEVEPLLVLRRQDHFVRSLYQEHVNKGTTWSSRLGFEEFRDTMGRDKVQFLKILRLFNDVFGQVRVMIYEDLVQEGLLSSFFSNLDITGVKTRNRRIVRSSLSVGETMIKQRINHCIENDQQNEQLLRWMRSWRVRREMKNWFDGSESFWPGPAEQAGFLAQFAEENKLICREFFDRRESLFPSDSVDSGKGVSVPDEDNINEALKAVIHASRRRLRSIIGESSLATLAE